jgi:type VI secretion system protein ImpF
MIDVTRKTRFSSSLMHVFRAAHEAKDATKRIDIRTESGDRVIAGRRLRASHTMTESALRREVVRDLEAVLNTVAMESTVNVGEAEFVRKSILNFGLPDISAHTIDEVGMREVPEQIKRAIINYEPRLAAESLTVERDLSVSADELKVRFIVRADLICDPVPVAVEFVADVTEAGTIVVNRL